MTAIDSGTRAIETSVAAQDVFKGDSEAGPSRAAVSSQDVWLVSGPASTWGGTRVWWPELQKRLVDLIALREGWDSYQGRSLSPRAVHALVEALTQRDANIRSVPSVSFTGDGGLLCEWSTGHYSLDICASDVGELSVYFSDDFSVQEWEGSWSDAHNVDKWLWQATSPE